MSIRRLCRLGPALSVLCLLAIGASSADADVATFTATGSEQPFVVPSGVTSLHVTALGARGGGGTGMNGDSGTGGFGAVASAELTVNPGELLYIEVGGNGGSTSTTAAGIGGFNGGGAGGHATAAALGGGGGGGASDIRTQPSNEAGSLASRLVIAGGGGGGGGFLGPGTCAPPCTSYNPFGGAAGEAGNQEFGKPAGFGATPTEPGAGGGTGAAGSLGVGGAGGTPLSGAAGAGGGGGGGAYGGGGGGGGLGEGSAGFGAGGGSSAFGVGATNARTGSDATGIPSITLTYTVSPSSSGGATGTPSIALVIPVVGQVAQSNAIWRTGKALAKITRTSAPVGTTFSFALNESTAVNLTFTQRVVGRRAHGKCGAPTRSNARKPVCERSVTRGTVALPGHSGVNKVGFQGRISRATKLKAGTYTLSITATNNVGETSRPARLTFRIVS